MHLVVLHGWQKDDGETITSLFATDTQRGVGTKVNAAALIQ